MTFVFVLYRSFTAASTFEFNICMLLAIQHANDILAFARNSHNESMNITTISSVSTKPVRECKWILPSCLDLYLFFV